MSAFGQAVRTARRSAGFTQKSLAEALGIESITVSRWERGVTTPSLARLRRVSELTDTPLIDLVRDGGEPSMVASELAAIRGDIAELRASVDRLIAAMQEAA